MNVASLRALIFVTRLRRSKEDLKNFCYVPRHTRSRLVRLRPPDHLRSGEGTVARSDSGHNTLAYQRRKGAWRPRRFTRFNESRGLATTGEAAESAEAATAEWTLV